jgi:hypothetical protein
VRQAAATPIRNFLPSVHENNHSQKIVLMFAMSPPVAENKLSNNKINMLGA